MAGEQEDEERKGKKIEEPPPQKKLVSKPLMDTLWTKFKIQQYVTIRESHALAFEFGLTEKQEVEEKDGALPTPSAEEKNEALPTLSAEIPPLVTVSPLPSSEDLPVQDSPDSSTSPKGEVLPIPEESPVKKEDPRGPGKKPKSRTVFSQSQLCVLNDRFQRQKYLSLQQMQELSRILNLSYKQVKTWFQNQRMKYKRWQKNSWPKNSDGLSQGCLMNTPESLPAWGGQPWNSSQAWGGQAASWSVQSMQSWSGQFTSYPEEPQQQALVPFPQNSPAGDLESILETSGEAQSLLQQTLKYFSTQQMVDLFPNFSTNMPLGDA
ncbi:putative homeobox protein NANOG2 [Sorex fumeus]|uniref:putative homeobox protein NANOG2 n=1 Tax=Sorex fumeus TaxID=62283 RepID=UPI0024ADF0FA|nr:putative homeobox protein NANOG2 [Sorex fumeus]